MQLLPRHLGPGIGLLLALFLAGRASAAPPANPLEQEERLARPIVISVKEQPLVDVVARVGKETGVALAASEEVADERVTLFARQRPARELLTHIAQHLDYSWVRQMRRGVKTLVLIQDLAARRREEALRGGVQREIDKLRGMVEEQTSLSETPEGREIGRKPRQWRVGRIQELDELLNGKWVKDADGTSRLPPPPLTSQQRERFYQELRVLHHATPGEGSRFHALDAAARLYSVLPAEGQAALWQGEAIRFAYPAEANRAPLPRDVAVALGEGSLGTTAKRTDETTGRDLAVPLNSLDRLRGEFWLERRGVGINLRVRLRALGSIGDGLHASQEERVFQEDVESGGSWHALPTGPLLDAKAAGLRDAITLPPVKTPPDVEPSTRFADVLEKLAARVPYPILADGYTTGELGGQLAAERKPLAEVLARACRTFGRRCSYDQGYCSCVNTIGPRAGPWSRPPAGCNSGKRIWTPTGCSRSGS